VGLDGEGRITQVTAGSGQNPITGVNYNPYGTPPQQTVTFGSGDSDVFNYDPQTFRMTQYQFNVGTGGLSDKGILTWNANSTLQQLAITDGFNSTDTQTCTYGYDDMVRITSANCGSGWSQTFSFDPVGNITKNGSMQFQPLYNLPRNRISTVGSTTAQYDNNGNVLMDGVHNYTWDADGNSITVDTVGATFDALDRMVEQNRSSVYTQIVYSPTGGKLALMTGQTLKNAFVNLPGQATAVYTASGLDHYRHSDWLGSARLTSSPSQTVLSATAYAPFGETYATYPSPTASADPSFTGQNSDTVSGEYDFLYREYSTQGRWPSPDPAGQIAADPTNPQSWNRYAYVLNDPLNLIDPSGLYWQCWSVKSGAGETGGCDWFPDPPPPPPPGSCPPGMSCGPTGGTGSGGGGGGVLSGLKELVRGIVCTAAQPVIQASAGGASGMGIGGSAGAGALFGLSIQGSLEVVSDPQGNVGVALTFGGNPGFGVIGLGATGGFQMTSSNGATIQDLSGSSISAGVSAAPFGVGVAVEGAKSNTATSLNVTVGAGVGGKGAAFTKNYTFVPKFLTTNCGPG